MSEEQDIKARLDLVDQRIERDRARLREREEGPPPGAMTLSDDDFLALFEARAAEEPATLVQMPDGRQVYGSPWILALEFVEGGVVELNRYNRLMARRGGQ